MLETWIHIQESNAESVANGVDVRNLVYQRLEAPAPTEQSADKSTADIQVQRHIDAVPMPLSQRVATPIPPALEAALLSSLEKSRAKRPQTARELALLVAKCPEALAWSIEEADACWGRHERGQSPLLSQSVAPSTAANRYAATIDQS
jgi:hypothetical protein